MRASDGTGARVDAWMINRCKVEMRGRELYNVVESLKEEDEKTVLRTEEIESYRRDPFLCLSFFCKQYCPCIRPNRFAEAKFFDPSSTNIYCGVALWAKA